MDTDRELDLFIVEIQAENERLIREYLNFVQREREKNARTSRAGSPVTEAPGAPPPIA